MKKIELMTLPEIAGMRLDTFLGEQDGVGSRSAAQRLIEQGAVTIGGNVAKKNYVIKGGEFVTVELPEVIKPDIKAQDITLDVVYEDNDVIVVNKPKGMVVHPAPGHQDGTLVNALLNHCGESLSGIGGEIRPGIVHRIDKDTSGLIIAAKNDFSHQKLSEQLKDRSLSRVYECVVCGTFCKDCGTVDMPIGRHRTDRKRQSVNSPTPRPAVTHWEVLNRYRGYTHLRCRLETGRTHQIRVHMAAINHPILGDGVYGGKTVMKFGQESQCLFARELKFIHPRTGELIELKVDLPEYFIELLNKLEKMKD